MQLAFPVYSRTESREEMRKMHERAARVHAAVIFPLLASLIVLGPVLIPFVLGGEWIPAVRPAQILAVAGMVAAVLTGYPQVMLAVGRPRALLNFNVVMLIAYAAIVAVVAHQGLITVAIAVVVAYLAILAGVYRLMLQRYVGISIARLVPELGPAVVGCLALAAIDEPLRRLLYPTIGAAPTIVIAGTAGLLAYCLALRLVSRATWDDLSGLAARVLPLPSARTRRRGLAEQRRRTTRPGAPATTDRGGTSSRMTELAPTTASATDRHAGQQHDVLTEPRAVFDDDRADVLQRLVDDRPVVELEAVAVVGDVHVASEQHAAPDAHARGRRQHAVARDRRVVGDLQAALRMRQQPAAGAEIDAAADRDRSGPTSWIGSDSRVRAPMLANDERIASEKARSRVSRSRVYALAAFMLSLASRRR